MTRHWITLALAALAISSIIPLHASEQDVRQMLEGVELVDAPGLPGPVSAFGPDAFAVVVGGADGGTELPLVAATRFGEGRAVLFGKGEFLDAATMDLHDTGRLLRNAIRWASGKEGGEIVAAVLRHDGLAQSISRNGIQARQTDLASLDGVDVLVLNPTHAPADKLPMIADFVKAGGGVIAGDLGWGWLQLNPGKTLPRDNHANLLLAPMGLIILDGILDRTAKNGYTAGEVPAELTNASRALDLTIAHERGEIKLSNAELAQAGAVISNTLQAMPPSDTILLPRIESVVSDATRNLVPTREKPIRQEDVLDRLAMTIATRDAKSAPADQVKAHPAAATFPGSVPDDAPRVSREVTVRTSTPGWHSTGLYAAPGEVLTVRIPAVATELKLEARIGSTTCRLWSHAKWTRAPEVDRQFALKSPETPIANAFGGLVYIVVPDKCEPREIVARIDNAVEAPYFVAGETTLEQWKSTVRNLPAPRAEIASDKAILTVPSEVIRELDNPASLLRVWDAILDHCADLAAFPTRDRVKPQRYCADAQICAGYMHAGNPIMIPTSAAPDLVNVAHLVNEGDWGLYHETGHMHQNGEWTFGGTGEVTVNLFTLYVLDRLCGMRLPDTRVSTDKVQSKILKHIASGCDFDRWKGDPFLALSMYTQLIDGFGWDAFKQVFAIYRDLPEDQRPKGDDEKRDQWMTRFSRHVGRNLGPFFVAWGVPTSEDARKSLEDLPVWMPANFPPENPRDRRKAPKATVLRVSSENEGDGDASNALDGFADTIWHSRWRGDVPQYPHELVVDLGEEMALKGITVLPRQSGANGFIATFALYASNDPDNWGPAVAAGTWDKTPDLKRVHFAETVKVRYLRLVAQEGFDGQPWASIAELDVVPAE